MKPENYVLISVLMYAGLVALVIALGRTWQLPFFWTVLGLQIIIGVIGGKKLDPDLIADR